MTAYTTPWPTPPPGDVVWNGPHAAGRPGHWTWEEAVAMLRDAAREPWAPGAPALADLVAWIRRDLDAKATAPVVDPDRLYEQVADTGTGEPCFRSGSSALATLGYDAALDTPPPAEGDRADQAGAWSTERFLGLGCPWRFGLPRPSQRVVDLGCGASVDLSIAREAVGALGTAVGLDLRPSLLRDPTGSAWGPAGGGVVQGSALACPLATGVADLVVANGLPPLMALASAPSVLYEAHRLLRPDGELRFTALVCGPDLPADELSSTDLVNAVRTGKPVVDAFRRLLGRSGFGEFVVALGPSPFVDGYRQGPVDAATFRARRD